MSDRNYLYVEFPDTHDEVTIDFAGFCVVKLTATPGEPNTLRVEVRGQDDRVSILMDEEIELPEANTDKDEETPDEGE